VFYNISPAALLYNNAIVNYRRFSTLPLLGLK
jgi:hypothetical protein